MPCDLDELVQPERLELHDGAERMRGGNRVVVEQVVAGHDRYWRLVQLIVRPEATQESETVNKWHPQVQDNRVNMMRRCLSEADFSAAGGVHDEPFEPEHALERVPDRRIVVDDQDRRSCHDESFSA